MGGVVGTLETRDWPSYEMTKYWSPPDCLKQLAVRGPPAIYERGQGPLGFRYKWLTGLVTRFVLGGGPLANTAQWTVRETTILWGPWTAWHPSFARVWGLRGDSWVTGTILEQWFRIRKYMYVAKCIRHCGLTLSLPNILILVAIYSPWNCHAIITLATKYNCLL